jgi:putative FmdB family regulatory protein
MRYDYECPNGHVVELRRKADERDDPATCPKCKQPMRRRFCAGMAVIWQGRFHDPWAQKKDTDGLGSTW